MGRAGKTTTDEPSRPPTEGQILTGRLFNEPMRVETVTETGPGSWTLGLVGTRSEVFRRVALGAAELAGLTVLDSGFRYDGDGALLRLGLQAHALGIAWEFDPCFGLSVSRVDPLPHQLEAVYDHLLKLARVRFLLADDAGAGKTIMAGLLIRELQLRGLAERILIVAPSNLAFQWQRELQEKFDETFMVLKGSELRAQFGVNQWMQQPKVVTSLDLAKREEILPGLQQVRWDLVVVDEAHRMSARDESHKSQRYKLGELLRDSSDHILLLTATPHKGDPDNFSLFLQLLDRDAYADVRSIRQAMDVGRAPFYLRRTKEAMVYFPERDEAGKWTARKIFTKRIPGTVDFAIEGPEYELYREVTRFVKRQSARAAAAGDDPRARAVGFLMALYQRRLASSTRAMRRSLGNRADRLERALEDAQDLARQSSPDGSAWRPTNPTGVRAVPRRGLLAQTAPPVLPDLDELEEMEDRDRERLERLLDAITLAGNAEMVREEIAELRALAVRAQDVERAGVEAKLAKLEDLLRRQGFFDRPDQRLVLFTEFKDTLDYLIEKLEAWGFKVARIHGGMKPGSRDEPGTRLHAEQQFRESAVQVLVATEAAGEGINLQVCNILFNYDIPWNPNRLEQRMGRIHRYGQKKDCLIFNFVATNTIEGRVLQRLLDKLQEIRDALDDDAVFNVVGEVLPAAHVERVLRDYYAGRLGDEDLEERLLRERVFALELAGDGEPRRCEPGVLGDLAPAPVPDVLPEVAHRPEPAAWLQEHILEPFLAETRAERLAEVERVADHVELSLTELLQRTDEEIGRAAGDVEARRPAGRRGPARDGRGPARAVARPPRTAARGAATTAGALAPGRRADDQRAGAPPPRPPRRRGEAPPARPGHRSHGHAGRHGPRAGSGSTRRGREHEEPGLRRDEPRHGVWRPPPDRGRGARCCHRHDPADAQRAPGRRGPARLLLAVRRHRLRPDAGPAGTDCGSGPVPMERGERGTALLSERRRDNAADASSGTPPGLRRKKMSTGEDTGHAASQAALGESGVTGEGAGHDRRRRGRVALDPRTLDDIIRRVVEVARPERIILFGSAARGEMTRHSDVDLLIVTETSDRHRLTGRIYGGLRGVDAAVDVVVVSPGDVERYRDCHALVIKPALTEGKVVYDAARAVPAR